MLARVVGPVAGVVERPPVSSEVAISLLTIGGGLLRIGALTEVVRRSAFGSCYVSFGGVAVVGGLAGVRQTDREGVTLQRDRRRRRSG